MTVFISILISLAIFSFVKRSGLRQTFWKVFSHGVENLQFCIGYNIVSIAKSLSARNSFLSDLENFLDVLLFQSLKKILRKYINVPWMSRKWEMVAGNCSPAGDLLLQ